MATPDHLLNEDGTRIELEGVADHLILESSTGTSDEAVPPGLLMVLLVGAA